MSYVSMKSLLEAGVHFGHQTRRWNPKMKPYIFTERNGIYIIDLLKTSKLLTVACDYVKSLSEQGKQILYVSTKKQAQDIMKEHAEEAGMPFVSHRWLGGMLTNHDTVRRRINYLEELEGEFETGEVERFTKKEQGNLKKKMIKLERNLGGLKKLNGIPEAMFVIDPKREAIAIHEARKLGVKIISIVDTNCDPDLIDYIIPGNDDAIRAVRLITKAITDAIAEGAEGRNEAAMIEREGSSEEVMSADALPSAGSMSDEEATIYEKNVKDAGTAKAFVVGEDTIVTGIEKDAVHPNDIKEADKKPEETLIIAEDYS